MFTFRIIESVAIFGRIEALHDDIPWLGFLLGYLIFTGEWTIVIGFLLNRTDGIGLSAPQVGINVQLMVFNPVGERGEGEEIVLVNPRVNKYSKKIVRFNEGCLSFPGIYADVMVITILQIPPFLVVISFSN